MKPALAFPALLILLAALGCQSKSIEPQTIAYEPYTPLSRLERTPAPARDGDYYTSDYRSTGDPYNTSTLAVSGSDTPAGDDSGTTLTAADETTAADADETTAGDGTYIVVKGDTLYGIARKIYNDQRRWRDIWEANRIRVPDKNRISVGMKLILP